MATAKPRLSGQHRLLPTWDANGNLLTREFLDITATERSQTLTWDKENRLASVAGTGYDGNALTETYRYSTEGVRLRKITNGVVTYFFSPLYTATAADTQRHYFFSGTRIAERKTSGGTAPIYRYGDQVDSKIYTSHNNTDLNERYYAYGSTRSGAVETDYTFTGQMEDVSGLRYYNARYYDPNIGLFVSPDTLIPDALSLMDYNRYAYGRGNPVSNNDPSGHCTTSGDGSRADSDAGCWANVDEIYALWGSDGAWWDDRFNTSRDSWMQTLAPLPVLDEAYMQSQLDTFWGEWYPSNGIYHAQYNPSPVWNEVVNPEIWMPGQGVIKAVGADVVTCTQDAPWGCGNLLDDAALGVATGGTVICAAATSGGCLFVAGVIGTGLGGTGAVITTGNVIRGEAEPIDAIVSWGTTILGGALGGKTLFGYGEKGTAGIAIGIGQRIYDWWAGTRQ